MDRYFHEELNALRALISEMGARAVDSVRMAVESLVNCDLELAEVVIIGDAEIDNLEIRIDAEANRYLTLRSPVAADLRILTVSLKASHNLERIGDEAKKIAKRSRSLMKAGDPGTGLFQIPEMAGKSEAMVAEALRCYAEQDEVAARALILQDAAVDALDKANIKALILSVKDDPATIERFLDLIFISKSLERIADHATNLAEEVIFMTTAKDPRKIKS